MIRRLSLGYRKTNNHNLYTKNLKGCKILNAPLRTMLFGITIKIFKNNLEGFKIILNTCM